MPCRQRSRRDRRLLQIRLSGQWRPLLHSPNDVILTVDYHLEHLEMRWLNCAHGQEKCHNIPTDRRSIERLGAAALAEATVAGGKVIWIMESTSPLRHRTKNRGPCTIIGAGGLTWHLRS